MQRRRARLAKPPVALRPRPRPARALSQAQQQAVLDLLHAPRFADQAPAEIYASLLDEGVYHCSIRTMYRKRPAPTCRQGCSFCGAPDDSMSGVHGRWVTGSNSGRSMSTHVR
mgnify:CR=1 FL=1